MLTCSVTAVLYVIPYINISLVVWEQPWIILHLMLRDETILKSWIAILSYSTIENVYFIDYCTFPEIKLKA